MKIGIDIDDTISDTYNILFPYAQKYTIETLGRSGRLNTKQAVNHMYIRTIEGKKLDGVIGHGRRFRAHCKRLRKEYGLNIRIHGDFGYINKKLYPKLWDRVLTWLIDW